MRHLLAAMVFLSASIYCSAAMADGNGLLLVDWGRKDAVVVDLSTTKYLRNTHKQVWSYTMYANPQIDGEDYYFTLYQLLEFDCAQDKYRNVEAHTYDLNDRETGQSYTNNSELLQNVVPGTVAQEVEVAICHAPSASDSLINVTLQNFRKNYYQAIHNEKFK